MKRHLLHIFLVLLSGWYGLAVHATLAWQLQAAFAHAPTTTVDASEAFAPAPSADFLYHLNPTVGASSLSVSLSPEYPAPNGVGSALAVRLTETLQQASWGQYCAYARNLLILHRKADQLFPFHYFW